MQGPQRLEQALERYLVLRIEALQREERSHAEEEAKNATDAAARREVVRMVTRLILLAGYGLVLGEISTPQLLATLVDPAELARLARDAALRLNDLIDAIPDALRSTAIGAVTGLALLSFNSTSSRARLDIGGTLFVGVVVLSILGFASAASRGVIGAAAFAVGLAASLYVLLEFLRVVPLLDAAMPGGGKISPSLLSRFAGKWIEAPRVARLGGLVRSATLPGRSRPSLVAFLVAPLTSVAAMVGVAVVDHAGRPGPLLYRVFLCGLALLLAWCVWAFSATPGAVRIPLWSMVAWSSVVLLLVFFTAVSAVFAVAVLLVLIVSLLVVVLGRASDEVSSSP